MKRRKLPPDTRPDWRDPAMPVIRDYTFADGTKRTIIDPDFEHRFREHMMDSAPHPKFTDDPTYDLKKQRKQL